MNENSINFGFACITKDWGYSTNHTCRLVNIHNKWEYKLKTNVNHLVHILNKMVTYNDLRLFRIGSNFVPFASHEITKNFNYEKIIGKELSEIGKYFIDNYNFRFSFHPGQYYIVNRNFESFKKEVEYNYNILQMLGCDERHHIVTHCGVIHDTNDIELTIENLNSLNENIKKHICLENDEYYANIYTLFHICNRTNTLPVLDLHHHLLNNSVFNKESPRFNAQGLKESKFFVYNHGSFLSTYRDLFNIWKKRNIKPKIHISTCIHDCEFTINKLRKHSDDIITEDYIINFINFKQFENRNIDVMIEAKNKERATLLFKNDLQLHQLKKYI